jgi:hypothetical protein
MARLATILKALTRALARDQKSIWSLAGNNFFITAVILITAGKMYEAAGFFGLTIGLIILFPLSTDPLRKIPASRLGIWPLNRRERGMLRAASPWVNPMTWVLAGLAIWALRGKVSLSLLAVAAGLIASGFVLSALPIPDPGRWRYLPNFPTPLNQLIRKNIRGIVSTLDVYCALLLSVLTLGYRLTSRAPEPEALMVMTVLTVVALSSIAQCLFGLDGRGGLSRYRLLPLRGWQILAAKDAAFLLVTLVITLPLAPLAGLGAGLVALTVGHANSVDAPRPQVRWRFSTGGSFWPQGLIQVGAIALATSSILLNSVLFLFPCIAACIISTWWYGRALDISARRMVRATWHADVTIRALPRSSN